MGKTRPPEDAVVRYFAEPGLPAHRQFLALRRFFLDGCGAEEVAAEFGYSANTVYTLARNFKGKLRRCAELGEDPFFQALRPGRKMADRDDELVEAIISYRKKYLSVPDIKILLDGKGNHASQGFIYRVCDENGFARLPKRGRQELMESSGYAGILQAPAAEICPFSQSERFSSKGVGVLCFLPFIKAYGIDRAIEQSSYPETGQIGKLNSILAFLEYCFYNFHFLNISLHLKRIALSIIPECII